MRGLRAFVDEFGDSNLTVEKTGVTSFFIVTAILVDEKILSEQRQRAGAIRSRFFQTGEMKSSRVGNNDDRREEILREINTLGIRTITLAVDKRALNKEGGLAWKRSFFKYVSRRLYEKLFRVFENVALVADEHGDESFMNEFKEYIAREIPQDLFGKRSFEFARSEDEVFLQVADFVSGTLARSFDPGKKSQRAARFLEMLTERSIGIDVWPPRILPPVQNDSSEDDTRKQDRMVREHCFRQAVLFLEKNAQERDRDSDVRVQLEALEYLLFMARYVDPRSFVSTARLLDYLREFHGFDLSEYQVRSTVVSRLRDAGVIVAGSTKGLKIPVSIDDVLEFVSHANSMIPPMLSRLGRARSELKMATMGELDILAGTGCDELRRILEAHERPEP